MSPAFVDYNYLYVIEDPFKRRFVRGAVKADRQIDRQSLLAGDLRPVNPIPIGRAEGRVVADIVWTDNISVVLISQRLAEVLRGAGFTGWSTYAVRFVGEQDASHAGLAVTGRCGPLDRSRGEWLNKDDEPGRFLRGLFFQGDAWDGSDFFLPMGTAYVFITQRVRDLLVRERIQNIRLDRLCDVMTAEVVALCSHDGAPEGFEPFR